MTIQRIQLLSTVDPHEWDDLSRGLGGTFFHCHAHILYESSRPNRTPCFIKAFDEQGECVGIAAGTILTPRYWPFSRFCRIATFGALPATKERTVESEQVIVAALEKELRRKGIFLIEIASFDSPNSVHVLSGLSYEMTNRVEFYLNLDRPLENIWKTLVGECRNMIRKAQKLGVVTNVEKSRNGLDLLYAFQKESVRRRGLVFQKPGKREQEAMLTLLNSSRAELLISRHGDIPTNAAIFGMFGGRGYYLLSGSAGAGRKNAGPSHLIWTVIERMKAAGATVLNLGGSAVPKGDDDPAAGLYRFKRDFGVTIVSQPAGVKTISRTGVALNTFLRTIRDVLGDGRKAWLSARGKAGSFFSYFYKVPWCVPLWGWREFSSSVRCLMKGNIAQGTYSKIFAEAIRSSLGLSYALPVNRGRTAIEVALRAMKIEEGDEIVLPSYVCHAVLEAVLRAGGRPVFADIGPDMQITSEAVKAALTPRTRCVIVPHLFGNAAPVDEIEDLLKGTETYLIDDAAQSFGARRAGRPVGTFGTCGILSCGPGKALAGTAGGILVTNNQELYERAAAVRLRPERPAKIALRVLSFWIWRRLRRWTLPIAVIMSRWFKVKINKEETHVPAAMSNLEAAIGLEQLRAFRANSERRRKNAEVLLQFLNGWSRYRISDLSEGVVVKMVLLLPPEGPKADDFIRSMARLGVECRNGYTPLHLRFGNAVRPLVNTETFWKRVVEIPVEIGLRDSGRNRLPLSKKGIDVSDGTGECDA